MDRAIGLEEYYLKAEEKSFLDAISWDEKCRMFFLTGDERAVLDASDEEVEEDVAAPSLPSLWADERRRAAPFFEPVEHPMDTAAILQDTLRRCFRLPLSLWRFMGAYR